jgi:hypothetical protein
MAILSWLRSRKHFTRRNAVDEFREYTHAELQRLRGSDSDFDEALYRQAMELVLSKLETRTGSQGS